MKNDKNWQISLEKFLKKWKNREEVIGAIVCGSYITGHPTKHSDVDVHILLDSNTSWRERGNEIIDGILIEYFANSVKRHHQYLEEDANSRSRVNAHMFCTGKVLFDKTGDLRKLVRYSSKYLKKKNPKQSKIEIELGKYNVWDMCDNLEEVFAANSEEFFFVFHNYLNLLFETYAKFLRFDSMPIHKLRRFLVNKDDKKKYHVSDFPDKRFVKMFMSVLPLKDKSEMMTQYKKMTKHVLKEMGGFDIDGWKIRSRA